MTYQDVIDSKARADALTLKRVEPFRFRAEHLPVVIGVLALIVLKVRGKI